jgi:hypothetical protein
MRYNIKHTIGGKQSSKINKIIHGIYDFLFIKYFFQIRLWALKIDWLGGFVLKIREGLRVWCEFFIFFISI